MNQIDDTYQDLKQSTDEHRTKIADEAREFLVKIKLKYPEVQYLQLTLKQLYGYSQLRVYQKKPHYQEEKDQAQSIRSYNHPTETPLDNPLSNPLGEEYDNP
jgi:hypothetical protein